jgi:hypothetical protein
MPRTSLIHVFDNLLAEAGILRNFSAGAGIQELRNLSILVAQDDYQYVRQSFRQQPL